MRISLGERRRKSRCEPNFFFCLLYRETFHLALSLAKFYTACDRVLVSILFSRKGWPYSLPPLLLSLFLNFFYLLSFYLSNNFRPARALWTFHHRINTATLIALSKEQRKRRRKVVVSFFDLLSTLLERFLIHQFTSLPLRLLCFTQLKFVRNATSQLS